MRQAEHLAHPFDDLTFDLDRNMIASAEIGIETGRKHFRQHAYRGATAMHPSHEAWMNVAGRIGNDEIREFPIDIVEIARLKRKPGLKPRTDVIRDRLPDRTIPDVGGVVDHVIEHAMTKRADIAPVFRIERLARLRLQRRFAQRPGHAARSFRARPYSIAANAAKILRICGGL